MNSDEMLTNGSNNFSNDARSIENERTETENIVLDNYTKICICKSISRATMKKVIREGAHTVNQVKYKTGAGSGPCHGQRCTPRIEHLLNQYKEGKF